MTDFQTNGLAKALEPYVNSAPPNNNSAPANNVVPFKVPDWAKAPPAKAFAVLDPHNDRLSAGLETDIEEIRAAVAAIPPSAIATEPEWMKLARALRVCIRSSVAWLSRIRWSPSRGVPKHRGRYA